MDEDRLSWLEVECDGSACGSPGRPGWHVHLVQDFRMEIGLYRVRITGGVRSYVGPATGVRELSADLVGPLP